MKITSVENIRYKILLVEDDKVDQKAFMRLVSDQQLPYDYTIADSISEAGDILDREGFDIIITDYSLGCGTAFDILASVKNTPVIVITGTEESAINALKERVYEMLVKDMERSYLKVLPDTIEKAVRHKQKENVKKTTIALA